MKPAETLKMPARITGRARTRLCCGAVMLAGVVVSAAVAQEITLPPAPPDAPEIDAPEIIVPKRSDTRPPGLPAIKRPGSVDWVRVKAIVADTEARDAAFIRQSRQFDTTRVITPEEQKQINAQQPKGIRAVAPAQITSQSFATQEIARTRIPVLVPAIQEIMSNLEVYANENSYTANLTLPDGAILEVTGTKMRVIVRDSDTVSLRSSARKRASRTLEGVNAQYVISRHEQGVDLSFSKFNTAYMITIYCPKPDQDDRCTQNNFVVSLAESLALLNAAEGDAQ